MAAAAAPGGAPAGLGLTGDLQELDALHWRRRTDAAALRRADRQWTLSTVAHEIPFLITAVAMPLLAPVLAVVAVFALAFAYGIPALYTARGVGVLRIPRMRAAADGQTPSPAAQKRALGLLADLVDTATRDLLAETGLVLQRGTLGVWLIAPAGALLVRPGGHRVQCHCVRVPDPDLPLADRQAHLLLALRADELGFATVANLTFSGATWRVRRQIAAPARVALAAAVAAARQSQG